MRTHALRLLLALLVVSVGIGLLSAKPVPAPGEKKEQPKDEKSAFKPVDVNADLLATDEQDPKLNRPSKKYTIKLQKDKTYIIDLVSKDFDAYLRLLDKGGNQLAEDDDSGGDLNSRIIHSATKDEDHQIVVTTFNGEVGKFNLTVREFVIKGEAKARDVGKDGISITANINQNDKTPIGKLGQVYSVTLKKGESYTFDLESATMDSYLYVFNSKAKLLAQDDDSGGGLNSRITLRAEEDGVFQIIATTLDGDETGEFTLEPVMHL
jgi:hypothetical protein